MLNRLNLSCTATQAAAPHSCQWQLKALHFFSQQTGPGLEVGRHQSRPSRPGRAQQGSPVGSGRFHLRTGPERFLGSLSLGEVSQAFTPKGGAKPHLWLPFLGLGLFSPHSTPETWSTCSTCSPIPGAEGWRGIAAPRGSA